MKRKIKDTSIAEKKRKTLKITKNQLTNYTLEKHGLIKRKKEYDNFLVRAPLHATLHTTPYLQLLNRIDSFSWKKLSEKLHNNSPTENIIILRCMRGTLHTVPIDMRDTIISIYGKKEKENYLNKFQLEMDDYEDLSKKILKIIKKNGPQSSSTIKKFMDKKDLEKKDTIYGQKYNTAVVLKALYQEGKLEYGVFSPKTWREAGRKYRKFKLNEEEEEKEEKKEESNSDIEEVEEDEEDEEDKEYVKLGKWYFEHYSPATLNDFIWWSGLNKGKCTKIIEKINNLEEIMVEEYKSKFYCSKEKVDEITSIKDEICKMERFFPYEDSLMKSYKESRDRFYDSDEIEKLCFSRFEIFIIIKGRRIKTKFNDGWKVDWFMEMGK
jgi:hypothetical protein